MGSKKRVKIGLDNTSACHFRGHSLKKKTYLFSHLFFKHEMHLLIKEEHPLTVCLSQPRFAYYIAPVNCQPGGPTGDSIMICFFFKLEIIFML